MSEFDDWEDVLKTTPGPHIKAGHVAGALLEIKKLREQVARMGRPGRHAGSKLYIVMCRSADGFSQPFLEGGLVFWKRCEAEAEAREQNADSQGSEFFHWVAEYWLIATIDPNAGAMRKVSDL